MLRAGTMTRAIISFDTELSAGLYQRGADARANFESSILGRCRDGDFGIYFQMDMLERYGLTGVFFIDPMPALIYGPAVIDAIVEPIVARGHEVQVHIHTEWLAFARFNPVGRLTGRNIGDFPLTAQKKLIALARDILVGAGNRSRSVPEISARTTTRCARSRPWASASTAASTAPTGAMAATSRSTPATSACASIMASAKCRSAG